MAPVVNGVVGAESPAQSVGGNGNLFAPLGPSGVYQLLLLTTYLAPGTYRLRIDLGDGAMHKAMITLAP